MILGQATKITQGLKSGQSINYNNYESQNVLKFRNRMIKCKWHIPKENMLNDFELFIKNIDEKVLKRRFELVDRIIKGSSWFEKLFRRQSVLPGESDEVKGYNNENLEYFRKFLLDSKPEIDYTKSNEDINTNDPILKSIIKIFDAVPLDHDGFDYRLLICHGGWDPINIDPRGFDNSNTNNAIVDDVKVFLKEYEPIKTF